jgi:hypothetical protein
VNGSTPMVALTALTVGTHRITATYAGDARFSGSSVTNETYIGQGLVSITGMIRSQTDANAEVLIDVMGSPLALPTGQITIFDTSGKQLASQVPLANGVAAVTLPIGRGTRKLSVYYGGDRNYSSGSREVQLTIERRRATH